jgi:uncharacterized protein (TIGR02145 family)
MIKKHLLFLLIIIPSMVGYAQNPCPHISSVNYGGKIYLTIQIGSQCWLKENLNIGIMIDSVKNQTNNHIIEKYCYRNDPVNCSKFGGLYQWNEALQYDTGSAKLKGICPVGWHVPDSTDINKLKFTVNDSRKLKEKGQGEGIGEGTNKSGFSALLAGSRGLNGAFFGINGYTYFWTSTISNSIDAFDLYLNHGSGIIYQSDSQVNYGFSVRCIKN